MTTLSPRPIRSNGLAVAIVRALPVLLITP